MKTHRTIRFRLYPGTREKHQLLHGTAGACRFVWNHFVAVLKEDYEKQGKCDFKFYTLGKQFTILRNSDKCGWLKDYSAYIVKTSLQSIETTYKEFFKGVRGLPRFKSKYTWTPSFTINYQSAQFTGSHLRLAKVGWMKLAGSHPYPDARFVSGQVKYECSKWYAYLTFEVEVIDRKEPVNAVGLDRNCRQIALSDGKMYDLPDLKKKEKRRKFYQRKIARCVKGSNRRKGVKLKLQRAYQAERFVRKIIAAKYNLVFMEDLDTQDMTASAKGTVDEPGKHVKQKSGLNREILKTGWYILERCLSYKSKVVKVDPKFTSQTCSVCGHVDKSNRKSQSEFKCVCCGHTENADINAALNIWAVGNTVTGRGLELPTEFQALERQ